MPRILIMEDDALQAFEWCDALKLNGFEAEVTHEGREAAEVIASKKIDLLITDLFVRSGRGGLFLLAEVKSKFRGEFPIIAVTGAASHLPPNDRHNMFLKQAEAFGASVVMSKPFSTHQLMEEVRRLLE